MPQSHTKNRFDGGPFNGRQLCAPQSNVPVERIYPAVLYATLDPKAVGYDDALAALETERANAQDYEVAVTAVDLATAQLETAGQTEEDALLAASGWRVLPAEAIAYIRSALNL